MTLNHFGQATVTVSDPSDYPSSLNCRRFYDQKHYFLAVAYNSNAFGSIEPQRAQKHTAVAAPINFG